MLRELISLSSSNVESTMMARRKLKDLMCNPCLFSSTQRFPSNEVYICLDRLPLSKVMLNLHQVLVKTSSSSYHDHYSRDFYRTVREAMEFLDKDDEGPFPLLFWRSIFEAAFLLHWIL